MVKKDQSPHQPSEVKYPITGSVAVSDNDIRKMMMSCIADTLRKKTLNFQFWFATSKILYDPGAFYKSVPLFSITSLLHQSMFEKYLLSARVHLFLSDTEILKIKERPYLRLT